MGPMKLLRHKDNDRIRLLMRQDKTLKIRANHIGAMVTCWASHVGIQMHIKNLCTACWTCADSQIYGWCPLGKLQEAYRQRNTGCCTSGDGRRPR